MTQVNQNPIEQLKEKYYETVKKGLQIQKQGNIKAFTLNAIEAEQIAQKMQSLSRGRSY